MSIKAFPVYAVYCISNSFVTQIPVQKGLVHLLLEVDPIRFYNDLRSCTHLVSENYISNGSINFLDLATYTIMHKTQPNNLSLIKRICFLNSLNKHGFSAVPPIILQAVKCHAISKNNRSK